MAQDSPVPVMPTVKPAPQMDLSSINAALDSATAIATSPLPSPYSTGTSIGEPVVQPVRPFSPIPMQSPMTNQATSVRQARSQNAIASLGNLVGAARQKVQENKQFQLTADLKSVMTAKQNVANAKAVLAQDPNNKQAQAVIQANMKELDAILSDPKKQKALEKALQIDYTDMENNKNPEVAALIQAHKEFNAAGDHIYDNPAEASVAKMTQVLNTVQPNVNVRTTAPKSATPYADKAIAKDLPNMQNNPLYASALKQKEDAQKQIVAIAPRLIDAQAKMELEQYKQGNILQREAFKGLTTQFNQHLKDIAAMERVSAEGKNRMAQIALQGRNAIATVQARVKATLGITGRKDIDDAAKKKLTDDELAKIDKDINLVTQGIERGSKELDFGTNDQSKDTAQFQVKVLRDNLRQLQESRNKLLGITTPLPEQNAPPQTKEESHWFRNLITKMSELPARMEFGGATNGGNNGNTGSANTDQQQPSKQSAESVGADATDADGDEENSEFDYTQYTY